MAALTWLVETWPSTTQRLQLPPGTCCQACRTVDPAGTTTSRRPSGQANSNGEAVACTLGNGWRPQPPPGTCCQACTTPPWLVRTATSRRPSALRATVGLPLAVMPGSSGVNDDQLLRQWQRQPCCRAPLRVTANSSARPSRLMPIAGWKLVRLWPVPVSVVSITDRKSTRLNSSHPSISYAVFCL